MARWLRLLVDLVLSPQCEVCDHSLRIGSPVVLCDACLDAIRPPPPPLCPRCGLPGHDDRPCAACHHRPHAFSSARALGLYRPDVPGLNPLAHAVQLLKYQRRRPLADTLGRLLAVRYPFSQDAVLVPVPLHPSRLRERGFNQAALLARALARQRGLRLAPRALARVRPTFAQTRLPAHARLRNLTGAFVTRMPECIADRAVVLIDDVLTTGATAHACATALQTAGARRVDVYTVGRAP